MKAAILGLISLGICLLVGYMVAAYFMCRISDKVDPKPRKRTTEVGGK